MDTSTKKILPGDRITAQPRFAFRPVSFIVDRVLSQDWYGDRVKAGASDCWGFDVEFIDKEGAYHHWVQNQDHGIAERKAGRYWLPVSDDGSLSPGDQITIHWMDQAGTEGYAIVKYEGRDPIKMGHIFRSVTYGWTYTLDRHLDKITQDNHPFEPLTPDNSTGWLRFVP